MNHTLAAELRFAAYWLRHASNEYSNHGCNDVPKEALDVLDADVEAVVERFDKHRDYEDKFGVEFIQDWEWMDYLADVLEAEAKS